ncbi:MAG: CapA family protein [Actinomycetota bacterium]
MSYRHSLLALIGGLLLGSVLFSCAENPSAKEAPAPTAPVTTSPTTELFPTTSTTEPMATATTAPAAGTVVIHAVGDVNLDPEYLPSLAANGYDWAWAGIDGLFAQDSLSIVNLECAPSDLGLAEAKEFTFRCAQEGLAAMAAAGVEVANLGNNHSQDFGKEAMLDGRANLLAMGVAPVGAGGNAAEAAAPALFDLNGWRVAVVGFGGVRPHDGWVATNDRPGMADGDTIETMVDTVREAGRLADWVIVTIHWGVELDPLPTPEDHERAKALIAAGADAILGHHPHRLQPFEMVDGVPVVWSLGNFIWPNLSPLSSETAVARLTVGPEGDLFGCLIPAFIASPGQPVLTDGPRCKAAP